VKEGCHVNRQGREHNTSLADWRRLAPPKAAHHWAEGRSAVEVAKAWTEGGGTTLPEEVRVALESDSNFGAIEAWSAEPEALLRFDSFPGEPRNTDLLVSINDAYGRYIVAVEAKADESYLRLWPRRSHRQLSDESRILNLTVSIGFNPSRKRF
jgi:hypothetical protein